MYQSHAVFNIIYVVLLLWFSGCCCFCFRPFPRSEVRHYYNQGQQSGGGETSDIYASLREVNM